MSGFRRLFRLPRLGGRIEREVDDELRFHVSSRIDDLIAQGLPRDAAEAQALREFGDVVAARGELASIDRRTVARRARADWWDDLRIDARVALRTFMRQPAFTTVVLLTLALGIGANGAIFSVVEAMLLRSLPYRQPERLVHLWESKGNDAADRTEAAYPNFLDWRGEHSVFSHLEGYDETNVTIGAEGGAARIRGANVTPGFFRLFGVDPVLGRSFRDDDDVPGGQMVVILSHAYWQREMGGDRNALGRTLLVYGRPVTVIGVLPASFGFGPVEDAALWFTLGQSAQTRAERFNHWLNVVGRLQNGVTIENARQRMATVTGRLASQYPETNSGRGVVMEPLHDTVVGPVRQRLGMLFGAVAIVLVIACANVASLVLARSIERGHEITVRVILGASRARLVRQLVTESLLLALAGGVLGVWVAVVGVRLLLSTVLSGMLDQMPHLHDVRVNALVLGYTLALTTLAGIVVGLVPALNVSRLSTIELRAGGRGAIGTRGRQRLRDALVAIEIACALVLVVGAALMARSLTQLMRVDPGFSADNVVSGRVVPAGPTYQSPARRQRFFEELLARARALAGVEAAGAISSPPLQGGGTNTFRVEGQPEPPASNRPEATMRGVAGEYLKVMRIKLVAGRGLTALDDSMHMPALMMNESLARNLFGDRSALGARFRFYAFPESAWTVVGVVGDVKTGSLDAPVPPTIYYSHMQAAENRMNIVVRSRGAPEALGPALKRVVNDMDPSIPLYGVQTMRELVTNSPAISARQYPLKLIGLFAIAALGLAIVGVYGVIAYSVAQRTRELALRIALGATSSNVKMLVLRRALLLVVAGLAIGLPLALLLARFLGSLVYGVTTADLPTYTAAAAAITAVALAASYMPARRAARVDPAVSLRAE